MGCLSSEHRETQGIIAGNRSLPTNPVQTHVVHQVPKHQKPQIPTTHQPKSTNQQVSTPSLNSVSVRDPETILGKPFEEVRKFYSLGKELGRGQFGITYMCREISTGNTYACKSILKRKLINKQDKENVKREQSVARVLQRQG